MAKVDKSTARLTKVLAEKFGKLIHDAPNESVRAKLRKCNAFGMYAKDALDGKELPDKVAHRMYELINRCINDWSDQYVSTFYDALIQEDTEEKQLSLDLDSKPEEVVESEVETETLPDEEIIQLIDDDGKVHNVVAHNKPRHYIVIMRPNGTCYDQEVGDDFDLKDFESRLSNDYYVVYYK